MALIPAAALPRLRCGRVPAAPLTADAGAAPWQHIEPVHLQDNLGGGSPNQASRVRTAWDDAAWRVLFDVDDAHPWATLTQRGGPLWTEEVVEVFIDPIGDLEGYFEVEINPLGTVVDLVLRRTRSGWRKDFTWQVDGLESLVRRTATGWAAELRVPFEALAAPLPMAGACWRVNFLRIDRPAGPGTESELSAWSPTGVRNFHRPERFGKLEFIQASQKAEGSRQQAAG